MKQLFFFKFNKNGKGLKRGGRWGVEEMDSRGSGKYFPVATTVQI